MRKLNWKRGIITGLLSGVLTYVMGIWFLPADVTLFLSLGVTFGNFITGIFMKD